MPNDVTRPISFPLHRRHCPFCPPVTRPIPFPTHHRHCCRGISLVRGGVLQALPPATGCSTCLSWTTPPRSVVRRRSGWRCAHALALASSTFSPTTTTRRSSAQRVGSRYGTGASASVQTAARATCACTEGASAVSRAAPASVPDSTRPSLYLSRVRVGTHKSQRPFFPYVATPFLPYVEKLMFFCSFLQLPRRFTLSYARLWRALVLADAEAIRTEASPQKRPHARFLTRWQQLILIKRRCNGQIVGLGDAFDDPNHLTITSQLPPDHTPQAHPN